ncbi:hypothetical protein AB0G79_26030 [Streptomyces sp. NPDC020807]|uniref:hypothetical protein n=1 Tax=Streptomyces sp. NPDC020807 TaxID=3155119 RepID=UPI0033E2F01A
MNRSLQLRTFPSSVVRPGEIVVARDFTMPGRGRITCPAGDAIAADLRRLGGRVRRGPLPVEDAPGHERATVYTASYLDRAGRAVGFAVGAHPNEAGLASDAVARWARALRSRRLVTADIGLPCLCLESPPPAGTGVDLPPQARGGRPVLPTPPGRPTPCPAAAMSLADARTYAERGDTVVLVGESQASVAALGAEGPGRTVVVRSAVEAAALDVPRPERISFVVQPGLPAEEAMPVLAALRERFPLLRGHHFDALCLRASDRTASASVASTGADVALVLGEPADADSARLARACSPAHRTRIVDRLDQVGPGLVESATTVALVPARTAPARLAAAVEQALTGLGPLTVISRSVSSTGQESPVRAPRRPGRCCARRIPGSD